MSADTTMTDEPDLSAAEVAWTIAEAQRVGPYLPNGYAFFHPTDGRWHMDWRTRVETNGGSATCNSDLPGLMLPDFKPAAAVKPALLCEGCWGELDKRVMRPYPGQARSGTGPARAQ